jgi:hypothetical protein
MADTMATLIDRGVISGSEARMVLANDPESGFAGIDVDAEIEMPDFALQEVEGNEESTAPDTTTGSN